MLLDIREIQHVTPALSKSIRAIERSLEVRLFERSRWGVSPRSFGEAVLAGAGTAIRSVDEVLSEIRRLRGLEAGTVRVGAGPYALDLSVAAAAVRLAHRHPTLFQAPGAEVESGPKGQPRPRGDPTGRDGGGW
jgi:DNA-binding transcriptional LysR family regulator